MPETTHRRTRANGIELEIWNHGRGRREYDRRSAARQLAGALPRDDPAVDRIETGTPDSVHVYLTAENESFHPPEGWTVVDVLTFDSGGAGLTLRRD